MVVVTEQVYLPIFQTAGSVEVAVNLIQDHVAAFDAEEDPTRRGHHEAALRRKIAADITVRFHFMEALIEGADGLKDVVIQSEVELFEK